MSNEYEVKIAILETKVDNIQQTLDNMPAKLAELMNDRIQISILKCSQNRDSRFMGIKTAHLSAGSISAFLIGAWETLKYFSKKG
jgi:hypothetical protein